MTLPARDPGRSKTRAETWLIQLNRIFAYLGIVCLLCLMAVISVDVLLRYVFNEPLQWADEFAAYFLSGIVFFALAYTLQENAHIKVDIITAILPERVRGWLAVAVHVIGTFFAILLLMGAYARVHSFWRLNTQSMGQFEFSLYWPASVTLLGTIMFLLVMAMRTVRLIIDIRHPDRGGAP